MASALTIDYTQFDCGDDDLNDFLIHDSLPESRDYFSSTELAVYKGDVIGFFTLVTDTIHLKQTMRDALSIDYPYGLAEEGIDKPGQEQEHDDDETFFYFTISFFSDR